MNIYMYIHVKNMYIHVICILEKVDDAFWYTVMWSHLAAILVLSFLAVKCMVVYACNLLKIGKYFYGEDRGTSVIYVGL